MARQTQHTIRFTIAKDSEQFRFCEGLRYAGFGRFGAPFFHEEADATRDTYFYLYPPKGVVGSAWWPESLLHFASLGFTVKHVTNP